MLVHTPPVVETGAAVTAADAAAEAFVTADTAAEVQAFYARDQELLLGFFIAEDAGGGGRCG